LEGETVLIQSPSDDTTPPMIERRAIVTPDSSNMRLRTPDSVILHKHKFKEN
jgi:hypothetical protein